MNVIFIICDNCIHYHWYYDKCDKWDCEVDARECHSCREKHNAKKSDFMRWREQVDAYPVSRLCIRAVACMLGANPNPH